MRGRWQQVSWPTVDPRIVWWTTHGLAGLGASGAVVASLSSLFTAAGTVWPVIPAAIVVAVLLPRRRHLVLAVGAGILAAALNDETVFLWPGVSALVFGSLAHDPVRRPWAGWALGFVGAAASGFFATSPDVLLSVSAVLLGGAVALFLRLSERAGALSNETTQLRGQAAWLEQRTALARELHDVVGHHVTAMVVQAEAGLVDDPARALTTIGDLGRTALRELDALVVHLRDVDTPLTVSAPPRLADIDELLAGPLRSQGVSVSVGVASDLDLDEVQTLTIYRIAQESLTNVARHARATSAWVSVGCFADRLRLQVVDDGVGRPAEITRGSGLLGIDERVRAVDGFWAITERPGGGTVVDVFLPWGPR